MMSTPPRSRSSSGSELSSRRHSPSLSLDLTDLPALSEPSPPSNTLIITNLDDPTIFTPSNLATIRAALDTPSTPLYSFSPLRSLRRLIVSFHTIESSISVRATLDGATLLGARIRVYFGQETKIIGEGEEGMTRLKAPGTGKLFFISPPPSPPHGWESREEEPPNKEVFAGDLAAALTRMSGSGSGAASCFAASSADDASWTRGSQQQRQYDANGLKEAVLKNRQRSDSRTIVYDPLNHGDSPDLPAISVEDMSEGETSPVEAKGGFEAEMEMMKGVTLTKTARPPVELME